MKALSFFLTTMAAWPLLAQVKIDLNDMSAFRSQAGNWMIVGEVLMDRSKDVHDRVSSTKKRKSQTPYEGVTYKEGTGILLNVNDAQKKDHLVTNWEHGDIQLSLEVMIPRGSNSGIYLQGRYEVQLLDSWGIQNPAYGDIGGIYRNWETKPEMMLKGVPPATNAAKAPGTWQKFDILFRAPTFDSSGKKITNAIFEYVDLNGVRIHTNVEVPLPTGGPISKEEANKGPLMIQGDHGPVAFRNIRYKIYEPNTIATSAFEYTVYHGEFVSIDEMLAASPTKTGTSEKVEVALAGEENSYGLAFKGTVEVPHEGAYSIKAGWGGSAVLEVDGKRMINAQNASWKNEQERTLQLTKGVHEVVLYNFKKDGWIPPLLGLSIKGSNNFYKDLHLYDSYPEVFGIPSAIHVDVANKPRLLRAFTHYQGDSPKLSHTIAVGHTNGIHYIFDLNTSNLVAGWRGDFIDATPMWENRGDGSFRPRGATQWMFLDHSIARLPNKEADFPAYDEELGVSKGYIMDEATGMPTFIHELESIRIGSTIRPDEEGKYLVRTTSFSGGDLSDMYQKLAEGIIEKLSDGSFTIDDQKYYINVLSGQIPEIIKKASGNELVVPVDGNNIVYEIIW